MPASLQMRRNFCITTLPETCFSIQSFMFIYIAFGRYVSFQLSTDLRGRMTGLMSWKTKLHLVAMRLRSKRRNPFPVYAAAFWITRKAAMCASLFCKPPELWVTERKGRIQRSREGFVFSYQCRAIRLLQEMRDDGIELNLQAFLHRWLSWMLGNILHDLKCILGHWCFAINVSLQNVRTCMPTYKSSTN